MSKTKNPIRRVVNRKKGGEQKKAPGWYRRESVSGVFYISHPYTKTIYHIPGPGDRAPTPKEVVEALEKVKNSQLIRGNIIQEYDCRDTEETAVPLPPGCYRHFPSQHPDDPEKLVPFELRSDTLVKMPGITRQIIQDVRMFLQNEAIYRQIGIQYRRGILLYGSPGQGKTTCLREVIKDEVPKNSITIFLSELPSFPLLQKLKVEEADRLKVIVFEELTAIVGRHDRYIEEILDFLDGESSLDRALIFGTTNYPELLPGNIVDRPSRFDRLIKVGNPDANTRKSLLRLYLSRRPKQSEVKTTKGMSVAAVKEAAILSRLYETSIEKAVAHLKKVQEIVKQDFQENEPIGLAGKANHNTLLEEIFNGQPTE